jgi:transposase
MTFLRGLYWCGSTMAENQQGKFINRDVNAALNIRECGMSSLRPEALQRTESYEKTIITFGRAIRCNVKHYARNR